MISDKFISSSKKEKLAEIAVRCYSKSLDVSLIYLFINDRLNLPELNLKSIGKQIKHLTDILLLVKLFVSINSRNQILEAHH